MLDPQRAASCDSRATAGSLGVEADGSLLIDPRVATVVPPHATDVDVRPSETEQGAAASRPASERFAFLDALRGLGGAGDRVLPRTSLPTAGDSRRPFSVEHGSVRRASRLGQRSGVLGHRGVRGGIFAAKDGGGAGVVRQLHVAAGFAAGDSVLDGDPGGCGRQCLSKPLLYRPDHAADRRSHAVDPAGRESWISSGHIASRQHFGGHVVRLRRFAVRSAVRPDAVDRATAVAWAVRRFGPWQDKCR